MTQNLEWKDVCQGSSSGIWVTLGISIGYLVIVSICEVVFNETEIICEALSVAWSDPRRFWPWYWGGRIYDRSDDLKAEIEEYIKTDHGKKPCKLRKLHITTACFVLLQALMLFFQVPYITYENSLLGFEEKPESSINVPGWWYVLYNVATLVGLFGEVNGFIVRRKEAKKCAKNIKLHGLDESVHYATSHTAQFTLFFMVSMHMFLQYFVVERSEDPEPFFKNPFVATNNMLTVYALSKLLVITTNLIIYIAGDQLKRARLNGDFMLITIWALTACSSALVFISEIVRIVSLTDSSRNVLLEESGTTEECLEFSWSYAFSKFSTLDIVFMVFCSLSLATSGSLAVVYILYVFQGWCGKKSYTAGY